MNLCSDVLAALEGKTLVTAESLTGGGIGSCLTAVPGSSRIYKGGVISYTNQVKQSVLGVDGGVLEKLGAVSEETAAAMVSGVRRLLCADVAVSVTGLAGPDADEFGNPVGTVFIGYEDARKSFVRKFLFSGDRDDVRNQTIRTALTILLEQQK